MEYSFLENFDPVDVDPSKLVDMLYDEGARSTQLQADYQNAACTVGP